MIEQFDLLADKRNRRLEEFAIESDRSILAYPSSGKSSKVVLEICRGRSQALHVGGEPVQRGLSRRKGRLIVEITVSCAVEPPISRQVLPALSQFNTKLRSS